MSIPFHVSCFMFEDLSFPFAFFGFISSFAGAGLANNLPQPWAEPTFLLGIQAARPVHREPSRSLTAWPVPLLPQMMMILTWRNTSIFSFMASAFCNLFKRSFLIPWVMEGFLCYLLCKFPRAASANYYKLGDLKQQKFILSAFWRPEVWNPRGWQWWFLPEALSLHASLLASGGFWQFWVLLGL